MLLGDGNDVPGALIVLNPGRRIGNWEPMIGSITLVNAFASHGEAPCSLDLTASAGGRPAAGRRASAGSAR